MSGRRPGGLLLTAFCLLFLWLPPLCFYGGALWQALTKAPHLLLLCLPLEPLQRHLFSNTIALALITALLALAFGIPVGIAMARSRRGVSVVLGVLCAWPLALPPVMTTFAWLEISRTPPAALMASYAASQSAAGNGLWRAGVLLALCFFPLVAFALFAALRAVPRDLEDAAGLQGSMADTWRHILLPLAAPALWGGAGLAAALAMWEMAATDLLDVRTYSVEIYRNLSTGDGLHESQKFVHAALESLPLVLLGALALWPALRALRLYGERAVTFAAHERPLPIGHREPGARRGAHPVLLTLSALLLLLSPLGPLGLFAAQLRPLHTLWETWNDNSAEIVNTILLDTVAAGLMVAIAFVLVASWQSWPARRRGRVLILCLAPLFVSPVLLGLALIGFYNQPAFAALYGGIDPTGWPLPDTLNLWLARYGMELIGYCARFLPLAVLSIAEAMRRLDPELREAAESLGATPWRTRRTVLAPLLAPALTTTFIVLSALCGAELATTVLVQQPGGQPLMVPLFQLMHIFDLPGVAALCLTLAALGALAFAFSGLALKLRARL